MRNEHEHQPHPLTFEEVENRAKETVLALGRHVPTLIVDGGQQGIVVELQDVGETHEMRVRQMFLVGFAVAQSGEVPSLKQVFFVTEAWMSTAEDGQLPELPPSQDPKRKEILLISNLQMTDRQMQVATIEMMRDAQGVLRELKDFAPEGSSQDRAESPLLAAFVYGYREGSIWVSDASDDPQH